MSTLVRQPLKTEPQEESTLKLLGDLFTKLGIEPYSTESVQKYKTQQARKHTSFLASFYETIGSSRFQRKYINIAVPGLVLGLLDFVTALLWASGYEKGPFRPYMMQFIVSHHVWIIHTVIGIWALGGLGVGCLLDRLNHKTYQVAEWHHYCYTSWKNHLGRICPQFVHSRVAEIESNIEGTPLEHYVNFYVHSLEKDSRVVDPFLVLRVRSNYGPSGYDFYLDVWNEPVFEGRKTVGKEN